MKKNINSVVRCCAVVGIGLFILGLTALSKPQPTATKVSRKPNVLFIIIDDMNDFTSVFDPKNPIQTPHLKSLADEGVFFTKAYCNSPACCPSRVSLLNGLRPSSTGVYTNETDWKRAISNFETFPAYFGKHGYTTKSAGKIFHHGGPEFVDEGAFGEVLPFPTGSPDAPMPPSNLNGTTHWYDENGQPTARVSPNFDWGVWPKDASQGIDVKTVDWLVDKLATMPEDKPFFFAAGIFRPHMPYYLPQSAFDKYPLASLTLPPYKIDDLADIPTGGQALRAANSKWWTTFQQENKRNPAFFREAVRSYQAAATYCDTQIGRLLDALRQSPHAQHTLIVLVSDHGYHLGQKNHWEKFLLYEQTTHIPMIVAGPAIPKGMRCERTVSMLDLYPTLLELCGLPPKEGLEGKSLVSLLKKPTKMWSFPVVMTYGMNNHAVRDERWRYIRYADGSEELYDHAHDPNEWYNVVNDPTKKNEIVRLKRWLPTQNKLPFAAIPKK